MNACQGWRLTRPILRAAEQVLSIPSPLLIAVVVIALLIGGLIAIIAVALLGLYLFSWVVLLAFSRVAAAFADELVKHRTDFKEALPAVLANCPEHCRGDVSPLDCQLD